MHLVYLSKSKVSIDLHKRQIERRGKEAETNGLERYGADKVKDRQKWRWYRYRGESKKGH